MVPSGWALLTVGDVFDVQLGKMLNKEAKKKQPQLCYLGNSNVRWGKFELSELNSMYFSEREINKYKLEFNDILVCEGGEVGRCAIWEQHNSQILYQKAIHRLRVKGEIVPIYFQNYMQSIAGTKLLEDYTSRTSIAHLTREKLLSLPIKLPPLPEQQKIAKILSTWDKAISTTERLIENSTQQKKALMQQLLTGKKRLLDDEGKRFGETWLTGYLEDICVLKGGSAFKIKHQGKTQGDLPFIKVSDMNLTANKKFIKEANNWLTVEDSKSMRVNLFPSGSVVFAKVGAALLLNRRRILVRDTIIDNNMMAAIPKNHCETHFLYYLMLAIDFAKLVQEGAVPSVNQSDLGRFKISYPPLQEQQKIATVLTNADKEIELLKQQLADLQQEKKALMQVLLTGKRRVVIDS